MVDEQAQSGKRQFSGGVELSLIAGSDKALEIGLNIGAALVDFWQRQGFITEGKDWLQRLLARLDPRLKAAGIAATDEEAIVQALALHPLGFHAVEVLKGIGALSSQMQDVGGARRYLGLGLALARRIGDRSEEARLLNRLGNLCNLLCDYDLAIHYLEDSLAIKRGTEGWDELNIASTLTVYSWALAGSGRLTDALATEEENLAIKRHLGDAEGVGRRSTAWRRLRGGREIMRPPAVMLNNCWRSPATWATLERVRRTRSGRLGMSRA